MIIHWVGWALLILQGGGSGSRLDDEGEASLHLSLLQTSRAHLSAPAMTKNMALDAAGAAHHPASARKYVLFSHHKAGWTMTVEASKALQKLDKSFHFGSQPYACVMRSPPDLFSQPPDGDAKCLLHVTRNPFEMIVSGYMHHMSNTSSERNWLWDTFATARSRSAQLSELSGLKEHLASNAEVFKQSRQGRLASMLPDAELTEQYPQYLARIPVDAGLLAEYIWATSHSIASLAFTHEKIQELDQDCSMNVCLDKFYSECDGTWMNVLQRWGFKDASLVDLHDAVLQSCPGTSLTAKEHASDSQAKKHGRTHPPESEMISLVRKLDEQFFDGSLARVERQVGCELHGHYLSRTRAK